MSLHLTKPLVFFDLETTGVNTATDRIVQISMIKVFPDGKEDKYNYFVNPGIPIPAEATAIHGITDEMVRDKPLFSEIAPEIEKDGGGIELIDIDLPDVIISLKGACLSCSVASFTIENIKRLISQRLGEEINLKLI